MLTNEKLRNGGASSLGDLVRQGGDVEGQMSEAALLNYGGGTWCDLARNAATKAAKGVGQAPPPPPPPPVAPANIVAPAISGTTTLGSVLTATTGTWTGTATITYAYQWKSSGVNVGTNQNTYTTVAGDSGDAMTCVVTATNAAGSGPATSNTTTMGIAPANTVLPAITGTPGVGNVLTCSAGTWTGSATITYAYQWKSEGVNVGTNANTYTPVSGDAGNTITCVVTATNGSGNASATSNAVEIPAALASLLTDTTSRPAPTTNPRPAYLTPYTDPTFGTTITRVSGDPGGAIGGTAGVWGTNVHHQYNKHDVWNSDESMMYIETNNGGSGTGGLTFLNGSTYAVLYWRAAPAGWLEGKWDRGDPTRMIYCTATQIRTYNPVNGATALLRDFAGTYSGVKFGQYAGEPSYDGDIYPITATRTSDTHKVCFGYKVSTNAILGVVSVTGLTKTMNEGHCAISPNGTYLELYFDDETIQVFNATTGAHVVTFTGTQNPSHATMAIDNLGAEVLFGAQGVGGDVIKRRLSDGAITVLNPNSYAYHASSLSYLNNGKWGSADYFNDSGSPYVGEIVVAAMNGSVVGRICHTQRGASGDYENETHGSISPSGKRICFASSWRGSGTPSRPTGVYVADWRGFQLPGVG